MRYAHEHKEGTRQKILKAAARLFRQFGYNGIGVDAIMAEAGLTAGGFYAHFSSKRALFDEALAQALEAGGTVQTAERSKSFVTDKTARMREMVKSYLSRQHRDQIADGCPLPALTPDVARGGAESRENFERLLLQYVTSLESLLPESAPIKRDAALALTAQCVGGLMLSRAVNDERLSDRILKACQQAALKLGEE